MREMKGHHSCPSETRTGTRHTDLGTSGLVSFSNAIFQSPQAISPQTFSLLLKTPGCYWPSWPQMEPLDTSSTLGSATGSRASTCLKTSWVHVEQQAHCLCPSVQLPLPGSPTCTPKAGSPFTLSPSLGSPRHIREEGPNSTCSLPSSLLPAAPSAAAEPPLSPHSGQPALSSPKPPSLPRAAPAFAYFSVPSWPFHSSVETPIPLSASVGKPLAQPWAKRREWRQTRVLRGCPHGAGQLTAGIHLIWSSSASARHWTWARSWDSLRLSSSLIRVPSSSVAFCSCSFKKLGKKGKASLLEGPQVFPLGVIIPGFRPQKPVACL